MPDIDFSSNTIDAVIVAVYVLLSFGLGLAASRFFKHSGKKEEDYFLAGRKVPAWMNGISVSVTSLNADVAPAYCGVAVAVGLPVAWFYLSRFGFALMVIALLFAVLWRRMGISTGPEFFVYRFGGKQGKFVRVYSSLFGIFINTVPWIGAGILGVHAIFSPVFGIESMEVTLAIILPLLLIYVWISGFAGVIVTDVIQTIVIIFANICLCILVLKYFGGPSGLAESVKQALPDEAENILSPLPSIGHAVFGPLVVMAWSIVSSIGPGGNVLTDGQRYLSCKNAREAGKVGVWGQVFLFLMLLLLTLPALGAIVLYPELYTADPGDREKAYGIMLSEFLPVGFLGGALAALLSSVMSTIDSHLNFGAQTLLNDVYRPLFGEVDEKKTMLIGKCLMIIVLISAIFVVYNSSSLIGIAIIISGMFGSSATLAWAQWWWWRVNFWAWVSAFMGGPLIYFAIGKGLSQVSFWQAIAEQSESHAQGMSMLQAVISMIVSTLIWVTVALLTKPTDMKTLKEFYIKAQPPGFWGPVRKSIFETPDQKGLINPNPSKYLISGGLGVALVGAIWTGLAVLGVSQLFVGEYVLGIILVILAIGLGLWFRKLFGWHLNRMDIADDSTK